MADPHLLGATQVACIFGLALIASVVFAVLQTKPESHAGVLKFSDITITGPANALPIVEPAALEKLSRISARSVEKLELLPCSDSAPCASGESVDIELEPHASARPALFLKLAKAHPPRDTCRATVSFAGRAKENTFFFTPQFSTPDCSLKLDLALEKAALAEAPDAGQQPLKLRIANGAFRDLRASHRQGLSQVVFEVTPPQSVPADPLPIWVHVPFSGLDGRLAEGRDTCAPGSYVAFTGPGTLERLAFVPGAGVFAVNFTADPLKETSGAPKDCVPGSTRRDWGEAFKLFAWWLGGLNALLVGAATLWRKIF